MRSIPQASRRPIRKSLAVAALVIVSAVNLAACGQHVERANLGRCTNLPNAGGSLCEEIGGDYIFVDRFTGSMRRYNAAQAANMPASQSGGGQRNCLANPGIACSGSLNNRMSGSRSSGLTTVCSGGTCLSAGR